MKAISRINPLFILIFLQIIFIGETNEEIQHRIQVEWISNNDKIALSKLEPAGKQSAHGFKSKTIYVARAVHQEETETGLLMGIIPGKLLCDNYNQRENNCICYYSHEGKSYESTEFEVYKYYRVTISILCNLQPNIYFESGAKISYRYFKLGFVQLHSILRGSYYSWH